MTPEEATLRRRALVSKHMNVSGKQVLEIGAYDRAVYLPGEVDLRILDYRTTDELLAAAKNTQGRNINAVLPVDYVAQSNLISNCVDKSFDLIICNHLLEHISNLITWLDDLRKIMNKEALLLFSLPDRRYTFDYLRRETTIIDLLRNYADDLQKPSFWQILDLEYFIRPIVGAEGWHPDILEKRLKERPADLAGAIKKARNFSRLPYHDTHCNVFTQTSFISLMQQLRSAGLLGFTLLDVTEVHRGAIEFQGIMKIDDDFPGLLIELEDLSVR